MARNSVRFDLTGQRFGRLVVVSRDNESAAVSWVCTCDCGNTKSILSQSLRTGATESCGCLRRELMRTRTIRHGHACYLTTGRTVEFNTWQNVKSRCLNPRNKQFSDYGGRGITVCDRWVESFENFLADMGRRPSPGHSIDRIDNDRGYEPGNCRWATRLEQAANKRNKITVEFRGATVSLREMSEQTGIGYHTLYCRIFEQGMSADAAADTPIRARRAA